MDTMPLPAPSRSRWFAGLRRSRSRILGGVAGGFAEFWAVDPLLLRVLLVSPLAAAMLALLVLPWAFGGYAVPLTQALWLASGLVLLGYLLAWLLIPQSGGQSLVRRFLSLDGPGWSLVKVATAVIAVIVLGWLGLAVLVLIVTGFGSPGTLLLMLAAVLACAGLAMGAVWLARGHDLRDAIERFGTPGFGRGAPRPARSDPGEADTLVMSEGSDTTVATPWPQRADTAADTSTDAPAAAPTDAAAGAGPLAVAEAAPVLDSVDRARAAATAAADARTARLEAERIARAEQRRRQRAAARIERRERNRWGKLVAAVTLIVAGVLFLTDRADQSSLGLIGIGVVCLALLTAGVLIGTWFGSARWLIAPALLLAGALTVGSLVGTALDQAASAPPIAVAPASLPSGEQTTMTWHEGAVTVDLTGIKALDGRALELIVDRGSLTVLLPAGQWIEVHGSVSLGHNDLNPGGIDVLSSGYRSLNPPPGSVDEPGAPPFYLALNVGIGELTVVTEEA